MFKTIKQDYLRSSKNKKALIVLINYRLGNKVYYSNYNWIIKNFLLKILTIIQLLFVEIPFGIEIPFSAKIGRGLRLIHINGIVIHPSSIIGDNCTIFHQVTIGANEHKNDYRESPKLGDNVYIGAGAKIIGNIKIENNVKIGTNAVVSKDTPINTTVVGINKIIQSKQQENRRSGII